MRVLLIEDSLADVEFTRDAVVQSGLSVHLDVLRDGEVAMSLIRSLGQDSSVPRPDLVLLDLNLPRVDGWAVLHAVRSSDDESVRGIPVVVLTTSRAAQDVARVYEAGANSFVTKPMRIDEFAKAIRGIIGDFWVGTARLPD
jgi:DNA-binding response OmpR family regulator